MPGEINIGGSVMKREAKPLSEVDRQLTGDGWEKTAQPLDRLAYYEKSGINITAMEGPRGTVIFPSGPVRGMMFGKNVSVVSRVSTIGAGKRNNRKEDTTPQSTPSGDTIVIN